MIVITRTLAYALFFIISRVFAIELTILTNEIGAICKWVQAKPNNGDSYAKLLVDETVADYQIPGLIFNYQDIASFATVVPFENFTNLYSKNKTELYPTILGSDGKLVIDSADGDSVDELKFWTGIINRENTFPVSESEFYCVYIA